MAVAAMTAAPPGIRMQAGASTATPGITTIRTAAM